MTLRTSRRPGWAARGWRITLAPAVLLAAGACFATRSDVQILQSDLGTLRAEQSRRDSLRAAQLDQVVATLGGVTDSLHAISGRFGSFQADVKGDLYNMGQQLITIQELTGQSQRRLQELRAGLEERAPGTVGPAPLPAPAAAAGAPPAAGATTPAKPAPTGASAGAAASAAAGAAAATSAPAGPGPNQLYQLSLDQLRRGSAATARTGFEDLLRQYPTSDLAPDAQFYVAESWASSGNSAAADSAYQLVTTRYPTSARAATALYKHALIQLQQGRVAQGRAALDEVVRKYPRSDEAELARERLRALR
ncbi:MAG: tol-pal system protein YbgF [Gemmatimonadaceae bacterium]